MKIEILKLLAAQSDTFLTFKPYAVVAKLYTMFPDTKQKKVREAYQQVYQNFIR